MSTGNAHDPAEATGPGDTTDTPDTTTTTSQETGTMSNDSTSAGPQFSDPLADPDAGPTGPQTEIQPAPGDQLKHNITYRARADGTSRGAVVAYKIDDVNVNSEQPTLLPGFTFEVNTVLDDPKKAEQALKVLKEQRVACKNYLYTGEDRDKLADALDAKWPGPLPHTVVIAPGGKVIYRKTGAIAPLELKKVIADHLGRTF